MAPEMKGFGAESVKEAAAQEVMDLRCLCERALKTAQELGFGPVFNGRSQWRLIETAPQG
jgi:hypothetical protein